MEMQNDILEVSIWFFTNNQNEMKTVHIFVHTHFFQWKLQHKKACENSSFSNATIGIFLVENVQKMLDRNFGIIFSFFNYIQKFLMLENNACCYLALSKRHRRQHKSWRGNPL